MNSAEEWILQLTFVLAVSKDIRLIYGMSEFWTVFIPLILCLHGETVGGWHWEAHHVSVIQVGEHGNHFLRRPQPADLCYFWVLFFQETINSFFLQENSFTWINMWSPNSASESLFDIIQVPFHITKQNYFNDIQVHVLCYISFLVYILFWKCKQYCANLIFTSRLGNT